MSTRRPKVPVNRMITGADFGTLRAKRESMDERQDPGSVAAPVAYVSRERESAVDFVVNRIRELLIAGQLQPGNRLPSETDLAQRFQVSRGPIREAMKVLSALGVVDIVRGDGTYIADSPREAIYSPLIFNMILDRPTKSELLELRETIELGIERLILKNADAEDLDRLTRINEEMDHQVRAGADTERLTQCDLEFHRALGAATKNRPVERVYSLVMDFLRPMIEETQTQRENGANAVRLHTAIVGALRDGDEAAAREAIQRSVVQWAERFEG